LKKKTLKKIKRFVREIIPVFVGVLVALLINNWNENKKEKRYLKTIYASIDKELSDTKNDVEEVIPKQKMVIDSLKFYKDREDVNLLETLDKCKGFKFSSIKINSWKAISNSKIELVDYDKMITLSAITGSGDFLNSKLDKILDFLYAKHNSTNRSDKETFVLMIRELISSEKEALRAISEYENIDALE